MNLPALTNRFFALRHGESRANLEGIIVSNPDDGLQSYGLTERGRAQIQQNVSAHKAECAAPQIYCSDFLRTTQTARLASDILLSGADPIATPNLRERFFGSFDGRKDKYYEQVWQCDRSGKSLESQGVESVHSVLERGLTLIGEIERHHDNCNILLVAHGDVLQIIETAFHRIAPTAHRQLTPLKPADLRPLTQA